MYIIRNIYIFLFLNYIDSYNQLILKLMPQKQIHTYTWPKIFVATYIVPV